MDITILRARIIAITFMAGLAWSEGRAPDVQAGSGMEETSRQGSSGNLGKAGHWLPKIQPETVTKISP
jgi:hypothetical protein